MQLTLKSHNKNSYPVAGFLLKHSEVQQWFARLQSLNLSLNDVTIYPIPDTTANTVWGCMVLTSAKLTIKQVTPLEYCQKASKHLYILEHSVLSPQLDSEDLDLLFKENPHIYHPSFGLVELPEPLNIADLFILPEQVKLEITRPQKGNFAPSEIRLFEVIPVKSEDVLKDMEEKMFPKKESKIDKPLSIIEKIKLQLYKKLFTKKAGTEKGELGNFKKSRLGEAMDKLLARSDRLNNLTDKLQQDLEDLEKRNQKEVDKLVNLMKENPEDALKYAIPLDESGTSRGGADSGVFQMSRLWQSLSLAGSGRYSGGGGSIDLGNEYERLRQQYESTALDLIKQQKHEKAAFVYLKLLKDGNRAAQTLEDGKYYKEAAAVHLEHNKNKRRAAECYEKGSMTREAIGLYKDLDEHEKAGDLYTTIHQKKAALSCYTLVLDGHLKKNKRIQAALLCKKKMSDFDQGQQILLDGWYENQDAYNCLSYYLGDIQENEELLYTVNNLASEAVEDKNCDKFLQVLQPIYKNNTEAQQEIRETAYRLIAEKMLTNPALVAQLKHFNTNDTQLTKDAKRYTSNKH